MSTKHASPSSGERSKRTVRLQAAGVCEYPAMAASSGAGSALLPASSTSMIVFTSAYARCVTHRKRPDEERNVASREPCIAPDRLLAFAAHGHTGTAHRTRKAV